MKTLVFLATYNEAGNISRILSEIALAVPQAHILLVDDASRDGTVEAAQAVGLENLAIVERPGKLGLGTAHLFAFLYAIEHHYDVLVTMDADGSHEPSSIPSLLEKSGQGFDFVIGSRYAVGGSCEYTGYRLWVSRAANFASRLLLGIKLTEFTTSFRAFKVDRLRQLQMHSLLVGGYSFFLTTVVEAARRDFRMTEIPINFRERGYGSSKIPPFEIFRGMQNLLRLAALKALTRKPDPSKTVLEGCGTCGTGYAFVSTESTGERHLAGRCMRCGTIR